MPISSMTLGDTPDPGITRGHPMLGTPGWDGARLATAVQNGTIWRETISRMGFLRGGAGHAIPASSLSLAFSAWHLNEVFSATFS
jgi:hypothetical protein